MSEMRRSVRRVSGRRPQRDSRPPVRRVSPEELVRQARQVTDGYNNLIARLGNDQANALGSSYYSRGRLTGRWQELTTMYREDWLTKKIIDMPAEDMTKAWISMDTQMPQDAIRKVEREMRQYKVQKKFTDAIKWARLYGGSAAIILIDGQEDMMHEPLDLRMIMPGTFRGLLVIDRWNGLEPSLEVVTDMADQDYGLPEFYEVTSTRGANSVMDSVKVHHSRVIRFIGRELPYAEEESEMYWGASEMEHILDEIQKRNATSANIAQLVFQANLRVMKMSDLGQLLAMSDERTQQELYSTVQAQNMLMTSFGLQLMDASDSFETHPYAFSGLNDIYQSFMSDVAGAAEIPATKLFGKSPDGMNATGESDLTNYYESIQQKQENMIRPGIEKLLPVLCVSALGKVPDDIEVVFEPVESGTAAQKAELASKISTAVGGLYASDIINKAVALKELRKSAYVTGLGSTITDEDIEAAEQEAQMPTETDFFGGAGVEAGEPEGGLKEQSGAIEGTLPEGDEEAPVEQEEAEQVSDSVVLQPDGGQGSGNFGHAGRPGEVGGSGSGGGSSGGSAKSIPFTKANNKDFSQKIAKARASQPEKERWRVDAKSPEEYEGSLLGVTDQGSTFAVAQNGDIQSVCINNVDGPDRGKDLLKTAVDNGGDRLDAFGKKLFGFYTKNGFEPVSRVDFNEEYAPDGWVKGRDVKEPIIVYKYVGVGKVKQTDYNSFVKSTKAMDYDVAMKYRDDEIEKDKRGGKG